MKLARFQSQYAVHVPDESLMATSGFQVGAGDVWSIEATPMGIVVRRHRDEKLVGAHFRQLNDLILAPHGWGIVTKESPTNIGAKKEQKR